MKFGDIAEGSPFIYCGNIWVKQGDGQGVHLRTAKTCCFRADDEILPAEVRIEYRVPGKTAWSQQAFDTEIKKLVRRSGYKRRLKLDMGKKEGFQYV